MRYFLILFSIFFATTFLAAQEDNISELEELEKELEILESGGVEDSSGEDFSETVVKEEIEDELEAETTEEKQAETTEEKQAETTEEKQEEEISATEEGFPESAVEKGSKEEAFSDLEEDFAGEEDFNFDDESEAQEDFADFDEEEDFEEFAGKEEGFADFGEESEEKFSGFSEEDSAEGFAGEEESFGEEPSVVEESYSQPEESFASTGAASDSPNLQKERQIYNAYQYIRNNAMIGNSWSVISDGRESETYSIQYGDNLWDISLTLFGNPYFWPKIWSLNSSITNPHEIRPGQELLFIEGNLEEAPVLTDGEAPMQEEALAETEEVEELDAEELLARELPSLPEAEVKRPPLKTIPPSLAKWDSSEGIEDDFGDESLMARTKTLNEFIEVSTFVRDQAIEGLGEIIEIEGGLNTANLYQYVFVEASGLNVGDQLLVLSNRKEIQKEELRTAAFPVVVQGIVEIVENISNEKSMYKALVKKVINPIKLGSSVTREDLPRVRVNGLAPVSNTRANIIGAEFDNKRQVFGDGSFVYLDQGRNAGLKVGEKLQIIKNPKARNYKSKVDVSSDVLGMAYVVDVGEEVSTAMILQANDYITVGDQAGDAAVLSLGSQSPMDNSLEQEDFDFDSESNFEEMSDEDFESDFF